MQQKKVINCDGAKCKGCTATPQKVKCCQLKH